MCLPGIVSFYHELHNLTRRIVRTSFHNDSTGLTNVLCRHIVINIYTPSRYDVMSVSTFTLKIAMTYSASSCRSCRILQVEHNSCRNNLACTSNKAGTLVSYTSNPRSYQQLNKNWYTKKAKNTVI